MIATASLTLVRGSMLFRGSKLPNGRICLSRKKSNQGCREFPDSPYKQSSERYEETLKKLFNQSKADKWRLLSFIASVPVAIMAFYFSTTHKEHERPEFVPYEHLRLRIKPFPWGDGNHSLFHNKKYNALPDGYED